MGRYCAGLSSRSNDWDTLSQVGFLHVSKFLPYSPKVYGITVYIQITFTIEYKSLVKRIIYACFSSFAMLMIIKTRSKNLQRWISFQILARLLIVNEQVAIINNLTIMLAWSNEEAARYLEIYKSFERKGPELIKERVENDYMSQMTAVLTSVKGVNKTDVITLTSNFGVSPSLEKLVNSESNLVILISVFEADRFSYTRRTYNVSRFRGEKGETTESCFYSTLYCVVRPKKEK